jgi:hypothetical protein
MRRGRGPGAVPDDGLHLYQLGIKRGGDSAVQLLDLAHLTLGVYFQAVLGVDIKVGSFLVIGARGEER